MKDGIEWSYRDEGQEQIINDVRDERLRQDEKWGGSDHDDEHTERDWIGYIRDHNKRALAPGEFRQQMIRVAALAVAALESFDRKQDG